MKRALINRSVAVTILLLPLLLGGSRAGAQQNATPANLKEIVKLPGKVLSEATTTGQSGSTKLTGYRVEEVQLPRNVIAEVRGQQVVTDKAWRVTIIGVRFRVRTMPAMVWIDDEIVGSGIENETLSQVTAVTFDSSLIHEGGVVSFSYGDDPEGRVQLSPKLHLQ